MALSVLNSITDSDMDLAMDVYVDGDYAYIVGYGADTLTIIDISDTEDLSIKGQVTDATKLNKPSRVYVEGDYAYITIQNTDVHGKVGLAIVDISDKTSPTVVFYNYSDQPTPYYKRIGKIVKRDDFIFICCDYYPDSYLLVYYVKVPASSIFIKKFNSRTDFGYIISDISMLDDGILCNNSSSGLKFFDFKDYNDNFVTLTKEDSKIGSCKPASDGTYVYTTNDNYFSIFRISDGALIGNIYNNTTLASVGDSTILISGNYAFLRSDTDVISINISVKTAPAISDSLEVSTSLGSGKKAAFCISGNYLYLSATNYGRLKAVNISDPSSLVLESGITYQYVGFIEVYGDYVYMTTQYYFYIVDVSDKSSFVTEDFFLTSLDRDIFFIKGGYAYINAPNNIRILDVSDVTDISEYANNAMTDYSGIRDFHYDGIYLYAENGGVLRRINLSDIDALVVDKKFIYKSGYRLLIQGNNIITTAIGFLSIFNKSYITSLTTTAKVGGLTASTPYFNTDGALVYDGEQYLYASCYGQDCVTKIDVSDISSPSISDFLVDGTNIDAPVGLAASTDYLFLQSLSNKMTVVKKSDMSYVTHIEDDTYLDNAIRSFVSSRKLYVACQDIDAMTIVDVSDYTPIPPPVSGFIPRVMII